MLLASLQTSAHTMRLQSRAVHVEKRVHNKGRRSQPHNRTGAQQRQKKLATHNRTLSRSGEATKWAVQV